MQSQNKEKNPKSHEVIKKLLVLPLLPAEKIEEGLEIIKINIQELFNDDKKKLEKWQEFINSYFTRQWMKNVTPSVFSVYKMIDRTNNFLESYHRTLNSFIGTKPSTFTFLRKYI